MGNRQKTDWFDTIAYLLLTVFIIIFILAFVRDSRDLLAVLMILLLILCVLILTWGLNQRKTAEKYRQLKRWMETGSLDDIEELPPGLQEEMENFLLQLNRRYSYENLKTDMEYTALQNQINPHFLYNTLDGIRSQALLKGEEEIADMTGKLSRFFRYSIRNRGDLVTLEEELASVEDYFAIQKYRFEDRFSWKVEVPDRQALHYYLPKMTFQPIVENAIYHGLEPRKEKGLLTIRADLLEKSLRIRISDDGAGMAAETLERLRRRLAGEMPEQNRNGKRTGIAVYNVNKRLVLLFGEGSGLQISSVPGLGTDVEIRLPLVDEENRSRYLPPES